MEQPGVMMRLRSDSIATDNGKLKIISLLLMTAFTAAAQDPQPNFSGTWRYGSSPHVKDCEVDKIQQHAPDFAISEQVGRADVIYTFTYRTDGSEPKPERWLKNVVRLAHWEGTTLVLDTHFIGGVNITDKHEELSLSEDGKTLKKKVHFTGAKQKSDQTLEFAKVSNGTSGIKMGDTEATVLFEWGEPASVEHRGTETVYIYNNESGPLEVIFVDGKMTNSTYRKFDKEVPGNVAQ